MEQWITYEAFGAVGDGVCDDMPAIVRAHEEANRLGLPVRGREGAVYYISPKKATAVIKTSCDWTGSEFVIDDRDCEDMHARVFDVPTEEAERTLPLRSMRRGDMHADNPHGCELFVTVINAEKRDYIRLGPNQDSGSPRRDSFILRADGSMTSPVSFDFDKVTEVHARPIEAETLTLRGGIFTTVANLTDCTNIGYSHCDRGFGIARSRVEVVGMTHRIRGEGETGPAYGGFLSIQSCAHILVRDCVFTGHRTYWCVGSSGEPVCMGSYDILCGGAADLVFRDCTQTTDILDRRYWGLIGTNACRDLIFENCTFSRFDAHTGVSGGLLRGCTFGHQCVNLIGNGSFRMEDCHVYGRSFINLRSDYGSCFRGDVVLRDCTWHRMGGSGAMINGFNNGGHDFGYPCYLTESLTVENMTVTEEEELAEGPLYIFHDMSSLENEPFLHGGEGKRPYAPIPPRTVRIRGLKTHREVQLCANGEFMRDTAFDMEK